MGTIACVGAHALDAELMGGAVALRLARSGWRALMVHMTRGERSRAEQERERYARQLEDEMRLAADRLSAQSIWMGYSGGAIPDTAAQDLALLLREHRVDVLITHHHGSYHPRHVQTHQVVRRAVALAADPAFSPRTAPVRVNTLLFGENLEDLEGFTPTVYVDIGSVYETWLEALRCYELFRGGITVFPYEGYYKAAAVTRGLEAGLAYAHAFMLPRFVSHDLQLTMELCSPGDAFL